MDKLAQLTIDAHGGLDRWKRHDKVSADLIQGGALWGLKGQSDTLECTTVTVDTKREWASHAPFGEEKRRSIFTPDRVELREEGLETGSSLDNPRLSFAGHTLETPWDELQLAYFAGIAMWTYLNMPFLLAWDGVQSEELEAVETDDGTLRRLKVTLPPSIPSHSSVQTLYIASDGLLKRHDYDVEIAGGTPGAHFISDYVVVDGIHFPTKRRIFPRQPDGSFLSEPLVVSIDLSNIRFD